MCCKAGLVVLNSLNFCLSGKLLISPSNLKESLAGWSILGCKFFPFITWNKSCHSLLACRVSVEKSADSLMGVPLYVMCHFSLVSFNILSVFHFCQFDYYVSWCVPPWAHPSWETPCFLDLTISFPMFGKFSAIISSNIFSGPYSLSSTSGTPIMWVFVHLILSQRNLYVCRLWKNVSSDFLTRLFFVIESYKFFGY